MQTDAVKQHPEMNITEVSVNYQKLIKLLPNESKKINTSGLKERTKMHKISDQKEHSIISSFSELLE